MVFSVSSFFFQGGEDPLLCVDGDDFVDPSVTNFKLDEKSDDAVAADDADDADDGFTQYRDTSDLFTKMSTMWAGREDRLRSSFSLRELASPHGNIMGALHGDDDGLQGNVESLAGGRVQQGMMKKVCIPGGVCGLYAKSFALGTTFFSANLNLSVKECDCDPTEFSPFVSKRLAKDGKVLDMELRDVETKVPARYFHSSYERVQTGVSRMETTRTRGEIRVISARVREHEKGKSSSAAAEDLFVRQCHARSAREECMARKTSIRWDSVERAVHRSLAAGRIVRAALKYLEGRRCVIHATAATKIQSIARRAAEHRLIAATRSNIAGRISLVDGMKLGSECTTLRVTNVTYTSRLGADFTAAEIERGAASSASDSLFFRAESAGMKNQHAVRKVTARGIGTSQMNEPLEYDVLSRDRARKAAATVCSSVSSHVPMHHNVSLFSAAACLGVVEHDIASGLMIVATHEEASRDLMTTDVICRLRPRRKLAIDGAHCLALGIIEDVSDAESSIVELGRSARERLLHALLFGSIDHMFLAKYAADTFSFSEGCAAVEPGVLVRMDDAVKELKMASEHGKGREFVSAVTKLILLSSMSSSQVWYQSTTFRDRLPTIGVITGDDFQRQMTTAVTTLQAVAESSARGLIKAGTARAARAGILSALFAAKAKWGHRSKMSRKNADRAAIVLVKLSLHEEGAYAVHAKLDAAVGIAATLSTRLAEAVSNTRELFVWARELLLVINDEGTLTLNMMRQISAKCRASLTIQSAWRAARHREHRSRAIKSASAMMHQAKMRGTRTQIPALLLMGYSIRSPRNDQSHHPAVKTNVKIIASQTTNIDSAVLIQASWRGWSARQTISRVRFAMKLHYSDVEEFFVVNMSLHTAPLYLDLDLEDM